MHKVQAERKSEAETEQYGALATMEDITTGNCVNAVSPDFAVSPFSGTRQRRHLPSAGKTTPGKIKAHGKHVICRVPQDKAHGKEKHTANIRHLPCATSGHSAIK